MYQFARHALGRLAFFAACSGFAVSAAHAAPLLISPLLAPPVTFANSLSLRAPLKLAAPPAESAPPSLPPMASLGMFNADAFTLPTADVWALARRADPSLQLTQWQRVFNVARLGVFVVPLRSDPAERTNILLSAQAVDNTTIAPGEIFSFNETVGERTPERGYQDGLMFDQGQLVRGTGGGICLVATGLYNAALQAGLGVIERHPHSGIVGYAPPGCDAGIVYGAEDMRFQNTTDAPIIIKTEVREDSIVIGLFGQTPPPGRKVFVKATHLAYIHAPVIEQTDPTLPAGSPPVISQKPRLGFDVTVERFFTQGNRLVSRETIVSERRSPRPEILRVAAASPDPTPGAGTSAPAAHPTPSLAVNQALAAGRDALSAPAASGTSDNDNTGGAPVGTDQ